MLRIGILSDTHGLLRPQAALFLRGCDHIVHAGDVGDEAVLDALREIAPVTAVRGNNDMGDWALLLPESQTVRVGGAALFVLHDANELPAQRVPEDVQVAVCGHSHKPRITRDASGLLLINPGSAGPRRFKLPVSAAELVISDDGSLEPRLVTLIE
jgi:uncharacterized protein